MKKILSIIMAVLLTFGMNMVLTSCAINKKPTVDEDYHEFYIVLEDSLGETYNIHHKYYGDASYVYSYDKTYAAEFGVYFNVTLKGFYDANGQPYTQVACEDLSAEDEYLGVDLGEKGEYILKKGYEMTIPTSDTRRPVSYLIEINFNVQVARSEKSIHDYVSMKPETILSSYFSCDMQEVSADTYDLTALTKILGDSETDNYQYGYLSQGDFGDGTTAYSFLLYNRKTENGSLFITKQFHSNEKENDQICQETYQYEQVKDGNGYVLNETNEVFSASTYTTSGNPSWHYDYEPCNSDLLKKSTSLTYKAGEKDGYTYLSITGAYNDYPNRLEYYNLSCEMIYVIQGNAIVAWLYTHTATSPIRAGEWKLAEYCIPMTESIDLVDEELLASVCKKDNP